MRFVVLTIIMSSLVLSACGKTKKMPSEELQSAPASRPQLSSSTQALSQSSTLNFEYLPSNKWQSADHTQLKNRLELGMVSKLQQLAHSHEQLVFSGGVQPEHEGSRVDASDFTVTDNNFWFVGASEEAVYTKKVKPGLDIWSTNPKLASASHHAHVSFNDYEMFANVGAMHLVPSKGTKQLMLRRGMSNADINGVSRLLKPSLPSPSNKAMVFQWADVDSLLLQSEFEASQSLVIDGQFISSRRSDNVLYVVSRFWAWQYGANPSASSSDMFEKSQLLNYLPGYRVDGQEKTVLSTDCLAAGADSSTQIINITAIDLVSRAVVANQCVNGEVDGLYMSQNNVYMGMERQATSSLKETEIHQFSLGGEALVAYRSAGAVPGAVTWFGMNSGLQELEGVLYLVATQRDDRWNPIHNVYRMEDFSGDLKYLAAIDKGASLLKGSELLELRFIASRVYLMPMEAGVPVAVVDLLNQSGPSLLGNLALNGSFANTRKIVQWLGVGNKHILGIADSKNEDLLSDGVELMLLNVSNVTKPVLVDSISFGGLGTSTEAAYDLRALTLGGGDEEGFRIALPITVYKASAANAEPEGWDYSGLFLFDVETEAGQASLQPVGAMLVSESEGHEYEERYTDSRSILSGDSVFYYFNGQVYGAIQGLLEFVNGPF